MEEADDVDSREASSAPRTRILGVGASSGEIVVTVSSKMVVGVSGRSFGFPLLSKGANPDLLA